MSQTDADLALYHELALYTLSHRDPRFIHQHAVDAFTAQTADDNDKPIKLSFALIGLFLHIEKGYSGREVQRAHLTLADRKRTWPTLRPPLDRGAITVADVVRTIPGPKRDKAIEDWAASVWQSWRVRHDQIATLAAAEGF